MLTARALLVRLRIVVLAAWLAPLALFSAFVSLAPFVPRDATHEPLGPATIVSLVGWAVAAAVWLPHLVWRRCVRAQPTEIVRGLRLFARHLVAFVVGSVIFTCIVAFYASGMHVRSSARELAVLAASGLFYGVLIAVPLCLACAELFGRHFAAPVHGAALLPLWLREAVSVGGVAAAGGLALIFCATANGGVGAEVALAAGALLAFALVSGRLAHVGTIHAVAPLQTLRDPIPAERAEPRSLDTIGTLIAELAQARAADRALVQGVEERLARMVMFTQSTTDYFFELDRELRVSFLSDRFEAVTGLPPAAILGRSMLEVLDESSDPQASTHSHQLRAHLPFRDYRLVHVTPDGRTFHLQTSAVPYYDERGDFAGYRGSGSDVTAMVEAQRQLRRKDAELSQAQKMEAVGQLTGGVAHDFNNLLSALVGNLELLKVAVEGEPTCGRYVDAALAAAARGASLTQRLLAFSRRQTLSPRAVDVPALLRGMEELLRRTLGEQVVVAIETVPGLDGCVVDPHQLESALLNIAINARDAMRDTGRIVIAADNVTEGQCDGTDRSMPARYVRVAITDNGGGIAQDVLPHVFEPFFTTKEPGRGSGLGLTMVYGFVQQSGGRIDVTSELGRGTTVTMLLPAAAPITNAADDRAATPLGGCGVLVVEEDPAVAEETLRPLRDEGCRVFYAQHGEEALRLLNAESVDVVLTAAVLVQGMGGIDLAERIAALYPGVPTMLMTSRALTEGARARVATLGAPVLRRPIDPRELSSHVARVIASSRCNLDEHEAVPPARTDR